MKLDPKEIAGWKLSDQHLEDAIRELRHDLEACENAGRLSHLNSRQALSLVKALAGHSEAIARQVEVKTTTVTHIAKDRGTIGPQHEPVDPGRDATQRRTA